MKSRKAVASLVLAVGLIGVVDTGVVACGKPTRGGYVDEVQYGYYDSSHHYHYYKHPRQVHITRKYYEAHKYQYAPHGTQHRVEIHKKTTTTKTTRHHADGSTTTKHKTTTTTTTTTTKRKTTRRR